MRQITIGDITAILGVLVLVGIIIHGTLKHRAGDKINMPIGGVMAIEYNGHEYLHFTSRGLVHNPDCKCMKKGD